MQKYYVSHWALLRKAEMIDLPEKFEVHSDYSKILGKDKIVSAFQSIHQMFTNIYQDIADYPERFKMPCVEIIEEEYTKMGAPPAKTLSSKTAPFMFFDALINVLICGQIKNGELIIEDCDELRIANQMIVPGKKVNHPLKNVDGLYSQFCNYGLSLDGLKNYKYTKDTGRVILSYPDDSDLLIVLKWMADKAHKYNQRHDFSSCQFRLLMGSMDSLDYGFGADYIADRLHSKEERDCVYKIDELLRKIGLIPYIGHTSGGSDEGKYVLLYCENEKDIGKLDKSNFGIISKIADGQNPMFIAPPFDFLQQGNLFLRIRAKNIQNGAEYISHCSNEIKNIFMPGDQGCGNRGKCTDLKLGGGQAYVIDGAEYWKCGCHTGKFVMFQPRSDDVADYIELAGMMNV